MSRDLAGKSGSRDLAGQSGSRDLAGKSGSRDLAGKPAEVSADFLKREYIRLRRLAGRGIHQYNLIKDGDSILAAVSGGKDSLVMVKFLAELRKRAPVKFGLGVVHLGIGENEPMGPWLQGLGLDFIHYEPAPEVPELAEYQRGGPSPCFSCSRLRRNRLFELSRHHGCGSLALGHHLDDAAETLLMNTFFSGYLGGLAPQVELFEGRLTLIRPLFLVPESLVVTLAQGWGLPIIPSDCPADGHTTRQEMKDLIAALSRRHPDVPGNLRAVVESLAKSGECINDNELR